MVSSGRLVSMLDTPRPEKMPDDNVTCNMCVKHLNGNHIIVMRDNPGCFYDEFAQDWMRKFDISHKLLVDMAYNTFLLYLIITSYLLGL